MKPERRECTFAGADDMQLFGQAWLPEQPPRAVVALVHGFGEHGGRYTYLAEALTAAGYVLSTFDHRGHGRSPGLRGHVESADQFLTDIRASLAVAQGAGAATAPVSLWPQHGGTVGTGLCDPQPGEGWRG